MYKVERKPASKNAVWYEVMLSPFKTLLEAECYIEKYKKYYPLEEQHYKITSNSLTITKQHLSHSA